MHGEKLSAALWIFWMTEEGVFGISILWAPIFAARLSQPCVPAQKDEVLAWWLNATAGTLELNYAMICSHPLSSSLTLATPRILLGRFSFHHFWLIQSDGKTGSPVLTRFLHAYPASKLSHGSGSIESAGIIPSSPKRWVIPRWYLHEAVFTQLLFSGARAVPRRRRRMILCGDLLCGRRRH